MKYTCKELIMQNLRTFTSTVMLENILVMVYVLVWIGLLALSYERLYFDLALLYNFKLAHSKKKIMKYVCWIKSFSLF